MGEAPEMLSMEDGCLGSRVYSFYTVEDRRHMRRGISATTGLPYASSRSEEKLFEKQRGVEFIGKNDMPTEWKDAVEYSQHIRSGGEHVKFEPKFPSLKGTIKKEIDRLGVTFGP
jgi:hypothetical protein